jgi:hypothetical protein
MARKKQKLGGSAAVTIDAWLVLHRAVEEGAERGVHRAYKHDDAPSVEAIAKHVTREVMNSLDSVLQFEP